MDHAIPVDPNFEKLAIQLCLTTCIVSALARIAWLELKAWRLSEKLSPDRVNRRVDL